MSRKNKQSIRKPGTILAVAGIAAVIVFFALFGDEIIDRISDYPSEGPAVQLTLEEEEFLDKMLEQWSRDFRITSIRQTARLEGFEYTQELRYRMTIYLVQTPTLHRQLVSWRAPTYALTNEEKKVAKYILLRDGAGSGIPPLEEIGKALGLEEEVIEMALEILYQLRFLDRETHLKFFHGDYTLSPNHEEFVPEWSLHYVEIVREDGRSFNVQCIVDALKLVYEDFIGEEVLIRTYCPVSLQDIEIKARYGEIVEVDPMTSLILLGGSCPQNLTFARQSQLSRWKEMHSDLEGAETYTAEELLYRVKQER